METSDKIKKVRITKAYESDFKNISNEEGSSFEELQEDIAGYNFSPRKV